MSYIDLIEQDLVEAARRQSAAAPTAKRRRRPFGSFFLAGFVGLAVSASAAAGTLYVLRGEVIPAPDERVAGPAQTPVSGTSNVLPLRAPDPVRGEPAWALRVSRSKTGLVCTTVGQDVDGDFGIVGLDNRFRPLAEGAVDACGAGSATLVGARVFDARKRENVRSVVYGVAGPALRAASVETADGTRRLDVGEGGTFLAAYTNYPEQIGLSVQLEFDGGRREAHPLGTSRFLSVGAGAAWRTFPFREAGSTERCVSFSSARFGADAVSSPAACGTQAETRKPAGYFFDIARVDSSYPGWRGAQPVTAVWGRVEPGVERVDVVSPDGTDRVKLVRGSFVVVLPESVKPGAVRVRLTFDNGQQRTVAGPANLTPPPPGVP